MAVSKKGRKTLLYILRYLVIAFACLTTVVPLYVTVVTSLTPADKVGGLILLPRYFEWRNYARLFESVPLWDYIKSSFIYAFGCAALSVVVASLASYALSRFRFKGKVFFMTVLLAVQIIPQIVIVLPLFKMALAAGLYDNYATVVVALVASAIPYPILLLKGFFDTIPRALEEAATIDGCTRLQAFLRIILPLMKPALVTAFALTFFVGWDLYLYPMILTISPGKVPLTLGLARMIDFYTPWELLMAGTVIGIVPPILVYLLAQKYLIGGLTAGSDK